MKQRKPQKIDSGLTPVDVVECFGVMDDDAHFALLVVCGCSYVTAYRLAFPTSAANSSVASMASRKLRDTSVQRYLMDLRQRYYSGSLRLRDDMPVQMRIPEYAKVKKAMRAKRIKPE